jgi:hypothetical protein
MGISGEDLEFLLNADPLSDPEFDPNLCVEALVWLAARILQDDNDLPQISDADLRHVLFVTSKLFEHLDVWMRAGRKAPSRWSKERLLS